MTAERAPWSAWRDAAVLAVTLIALTLPVRAQAVAESLPCPRCGGAVPVRELPPLVPSPKPDRDLCQRYFQDQPYTSAVWSCITCGFSAFGEDFRRGGFPPRAELEALPISPPGPDTKSPLTGFLNAFTYYRARGRDAAFLGDLLQKGAWAHRLTEVFIDVPQKGDLWAKALLQAGDGAPEYRVYEVAAGLIPEKAPSPALSLLKVEWLRRSGEALLVSEVFEGGASNWRGDLAGEASRIRSLAEGELLLLRMAEGQFRAALGTEGGGRSPKVASLYLLGELNRRIGRADAARKYLALVVEEGVSSEELRGWAWEQLKKIGN